MRRSVPPLTLYIARLCIVSTGQIARSHQPSLGLRFRRKTLRINPEYRSRVLAGRSHTGSALEFPSSALYEQGRHFDRRRLFRELVPATLGPRRANPKS